MKTKRFKSTRKITALLSAIMLSEQLASTGAVLYAHAEDAAPAEYTIEQNVVASWDGGCNANIILTNLADKDTQNWSITFCTSDKITNLWGGTITECLELKASENEFENEDDNANEEFENIFEDAFMDELEDDFHDNFEENFEDEEEYFESVEEENKSELSSEVETSNNTNVTSEEVTAKEVIENNAETTEDPIVDEYIVSTETHEYSYDAPVTEGSEIYYQYTVEALDHNAVITSGAYVSIGYYAEGNDHSIWDEKAELIFKEDKAASIPVGGTYEYDGYTVEVKIPSYWDGAYNVRLLITNTSDETLHNWALVMDTKDTISGLYNAVEVTKDGSKDNVHLIKNTWYNQDIHAGSTVEVGYTAYYEDDVDVPDDFALAQIETEVTTAECEVSLFVSDEWENGGLAQIVIKNISQLPIEDWMIEFDSALDIKEIWGGVIESHEGEHYFIRNSGYAQNIMPGESWTVGILFNGEAAEIENVQVRQIVIGNNNNADGILAVSKDHMTINEDGNYELTEDFTAFTGTLARVDEVTRFALQVYDKNDIKIYETDIVPAAQWTLEDFAYIYGLDRFVFEVCFDTERYSVEVIIDCYDIFNFEKLDLDLADNDGDGLYNYFEIYVGTDVNNADTDEDELTDYQEVYTLGYNPLDPDTDGDGVADKDEDEDEDGISNKEEYDLGSSPIFVDSDGDNLLDSIEIIYGTSLILEDTNNDGISDYDEYMLDQLGAIHNADGSYTAEFSSVNMGWTYDSTVIPTITITGDAVAITDFSMSAIENSQYLNHTMVGYIGAGYSLSTEGNMSGAELTFTYDVGLLDQNMINSPDFCPTIYYFNSDTAMLEEVANQVRNGNRVTAHLNHFSDYILANKTDLEKFWNRSVESVFSGIEESELDIYEEELQDIVYGGEGNDAAEVTIHVTDSRGVAIQGAEIEIRDNSGYFTNVVTGSCVGTHYYGAAKTDIFGNATFYLEEGYYAYMIATNQDPMVANDFSSLATQTATGFFQICDSDYQKTKTYNAEVIPFNGELQTIQFQLREWDYEKNNETDNYPQNFKVELYKGWNDRLTNLYVSKEVNGSSGDPGWISLPAVRDGLYTAKITADGYKEVITHVIVNESNCVTKIHMEESIPENKGKLILQVTDDSGTPVPYADVRICAAGDFGRYGMFIMLFDCTNLHTFLKKTQTDANGYLECILDPGSYTILVDKDDKMGATGTLGLYYGEKYNHQLIAGESRRIDLQLTPYSQTSNVEFVVHSSKPGEGVLHGYNLRVYKGWGLKRLDEPVLNIQTPPAAFFNEVYAISVPMGRYTVVVEKTGYSTRQIEILATADNIRAYNVLLGEANNVMGRKESDKNGDGLNDDITQLICKGMVTTHTGSTIWAGYHNDPTWEVVYEEIMQDEDDNYGDYDNDGLKNGDEIEIFYDAGIPYIKVNSSPELIDTDYDDLFDRDEIYIYGTNPNVAEFIMDSKDYAFISTSGVFESGKAYLDFYGKNGVEIWGYDIDEWKVGCAHYANAIFLGGEISWRKRVDLILAEMFNEYAQISFDDYSINGELKAIDYLCRWAGDSANIFDFSGLQRSDLYKSINLCKREMATARSTGGSLSAIEKHAENIAQKIDRFAGKIASNPDKLAIINNSTQIIGYAVAALSVATESTIEIYKYSSALMIVQDYDYILAQMRKYGDDYVKNGVNHMYASLYGKRGWKEFFIGTNVAETAIGIAEGAALLKNVTPEGIITDFTWFIGTLTIGDTLDNVYTNFFTVDCVNAISSATNALASSEHVKRFITPENNSVIAFSGYTDADVNNAKNIIRFECFGRWWAETKYLSYLDTKKRFKKNGVWFIYDTPESKENADKNIKRLEGIIGNL